MLPWIVSVAAAAPFPCGVQSHLEQAAATGALSDFEFACLDGVAGVDGLHRHTASRMVVADAWVRQDLQTWERVVVRHFDTVDGSDPEWLLRYTSYLFQEGRGEDVLASAWRALQHAAAWEGEHERVLAFHRLRTTAAVDLWQHNGVGQTRVHALARDWLTVASPSSEDHALARQICTTSGPPTDC